MSRLLKLLNASYGACPFGHGLGLGRAGSVMFPRQGLGSYRLEAVLKINLMRSVLKRPAASSCEVSRVYLKGRGDLVSK